MMATKLQELRSGCFHAALDDEPMFVLLARDPDAPRVVRNWASQRADEIERGARPASDAGKVAEARQCADRMEQWRTANDGVWRDGLYAHPAPIRPVKDQSHGFSGLITEKRHIDGELVEIVVDGMRFYAHPAPIHPVRIIEHSVRQENDEYACLCGKRWDVSDGEEHP
jgi:hypothetical protein